MTLVLRSLSCTLSGTLSGCVAILVIVGLFFPCFVGCYGGVAAEEVPSKSLVFDCTAVLEVPLSVEVLASELLSGKLVGGTLALFSPWEAAMGDLAC